MSNFLQHIAIMEAPHDTYVFLFIGTHTKKIMGLGKVFFSIIFDLSYSKIILPHYEQNHVQI